MFFYRCGTKDLWDGQKMPVLERVEAAEDPAGNHTVPGDPTGTRYSISTISDSLTPMVVVPAVIDQFGHVVVQGTSSIPVDYWGMPLKTDYSHIPSADWYPLYAAYREEIDLSMPEILAPTEPVPGVAVIEPVPGGERSVGHDDNSNHSGQH